VLFLSSSKAKFITGETLVVDGGMSKRMIYHDDEGWKYHIE
jgi:NAD(P)-dependent dehydrogenase (short-subunit alcohol dehydrogenase family)